MTTTALAPAPTTVRPVPWWKTHWKTAAAVLVAAAGFAAVRPSGTHDRARAFAAMKRPGVNPTMVDGQLDSVKFRLKPGLETSDGNLGWAFHQLGRFPEVKAVETDYLMRVNLDTLRRLTNLESLTVRETGELEDADFAFLRQLTKLESLSLGGDRITPGVLRHLEGAPNLKSLSLSSRHMVGDFGAVGRMPNLESLALNSGRGTWDAPLSFSPAHRLKSLKLWNVANRSGHLGSLAALTGLEELELWYVRIDEPFVRRLAALPRLRVLKIRGDGLPLDDCADALAALPALEALYLGEHFSNESAARLSVEGVAKLARSKTVKEVAIHGSPIGDAGVKALAGMSGLRRLSLHHTGVTERCFPTLLGMRKLERLSLVEPKWNGRGIDPAALSRFRDQLSTENKTEVDFARGWSMSW